ncbi:hypothetical protein EYF80_025607 [Liparis tanakae]|uniref:Uncharacterized protein n=1 Tax=Liparis tanakae TaxID=230148 RepID=A0A4Z2HE34_9TELE|nr:hypothetical protein EYF80_025607 [Liparis tanakae]
MPAEDCVPSHMGRRMASEIKSRYTREDVGDARPQPWRHAQRPLLLARFHIRINHPPLGKRCQELWDAIKDWLLEPKSDSINPLMNPLPGAVDPVTRPPPRSELSHEGTLFLPGPAGIDTIFSVLN